MPVRLLKKVVGRTRDLMWTLLGRSSEGQRKRRAWDAKWAGKGFAPRWRDGAVPDIAKRAVEDEWFAPGSAVLDIGCGGGEIAAWLAMQGYDVTGVDFSETAIEAARSFASDVEGALAFDVVDICHQVPSPGSFACLFDRGCFHNIPEGQRQAYVQNVAASAAPGARFLLIVRMQSKTRDIWQRDVEAAFGSAFEVAKVEDTAVADGGADAEPVPGIAFRMIRR